jgi:hypothetical protein
MASSRKTRVNPNKSNDKPREFKGEKLAYPLVEFLNACAGTDVHAIVEGCLRFEGLAGQLHWSDHKQSESRMWVYLRKLAARINRQFAKYTTSPTLVINEPVHYPRHHAFRRQQQDRKYFMGRAFHDPRYVSDGPIPQNSLAGLTVLKELRPVMTLEEIINRGLMGRLRICDLKSCGRYFFARNVTQLHCSSPSTCKQKRYDQKPTTKARRKRTRGLHKTPFVK